MNSPALIADTPEKIAAFRLLSLKGALTLETKGLQMSRGVKASVLVRDTLKAAGKPAPQNKVKLLEAYVAHLREIGVLVDPVKPLKSTDRNAILRREADERGEPFLMAD